MRASTSAMSIEVFKATDLRYSYQEQGASLNCGIFTRTHLPSPRVPYGELLRTPSSRTSENTPSTQSVNRQTYVAGAVPTWETFTRPIIRRMSFLHFSWPLVFWRNTLPG